VLAAERGAITWSKPIEIIFVWISLAIIVGVVAKTRAEVHRAA
jgi:hypothetical protein